MIERRRESRTPADVLLHVWGIDAQGERFLEEGRARNISLSGALLQVEAELRCGDVIGVLYSGRKARFRVVWVSYTNFGQKTQVAIHRIAADECPWLDLLKNERTAGARAMTAEAP